MKNFIRKINIIFIKSAKHFKRILSDLQEEIYVIIRNRNYSKKYPDLFALFSIVEQEQNTQIFDIYDKEFNLIKKNILKDNKIENHQILEALRGILHNNKINHCDKIKEKIIKFLKKTTTSIINENNQYFSLLIKIILFSFPFLVNEDDYKVFDRLIKRKSSVTLKIIKDILQNYQNLEFFIENDDIAEILIKAIKYNNKPAFMLLIKFLRKNKNINLIFNNKKFLEKSKIFDHKISEEKGFDYVAVIFSYFDNNIINRNIEKNLVIFFDNIFSEKISAKEKSKRYDKINNYIILSNKIGINNSFIKELINYYLPQCEVIKGQNRSQISRIKKLQSSLFKIKSSPRANVKIRNVVNLVSHYPEEHWLLHFSPYLI